jgi:hypothetical protein
MADDEHLLTSQKGTRSDQKHSSEEAQPAVCDSSLQRKGGRVNKNKCQPHTLYSTRNSRSIELKIIITLTVVLGTGNATKAPILEKENRDGLKNSPPLKISYRP